MSYKEHYVVFGAEDKPNKGLVCAKCEGEGAPGKYAMLITEISNQGDVDFGDEFVADAITGEYTTLYFCKKESVRAMIAALNDILESWEDEAECEGETIVNRED